MKKYFFILLLIFLSIFLSPFYILSQSSAGPSFEVYDSNCGEGINCTPYPAVWNVQINRPDDNEIIITADVFDVSGVLSVVAIIETPSGTEIAKHMQNISGVSYVTQLINLENYPSGLYKVHIQAIDILLNDSMGMNDDYRDMASFQIGSSEEIVELWENYNKEAWGNWNSNSDDPYNVWYMDSRAQFIILASELESAGLNSGSRIKSFFLETYQAPNRGLKDFRIRIKLTTSPVSTSWEGGWTNFFGPTTISKDDIVVGEWKEYSSENGFEWDGEKNIMIDISRNDDYYNQSGGMYRRIGFGQYKMFSGMCDDEFDYYTYEYVDCALYNRSGDSTNGTSKNYVPALKIKYTSN